MMEDGSFGCHQLTIPATSSIPAINIQILFLHPSTSIMLWFSLNDSAKMGTTSMSLPLPNHLPATSTRIDGYSASDTTDRLASLLCRKYRRQVFVSAHLPRHQTQMIQSEDGVGEEVIIKKVLVELHRTIRAEEEEERKKKEGVDDREDLFTKDDEHDAPQKTDQEAIKDGIEALTVDA